MIKTLVQISSVMKIILIFTASFFITSCSTITAETPTPKQQQLTWQSRQQLLSQIQNWHIEGKIAVRTAKDAGSANINWKQSGSHFDIALFGPLGTNNMKLQGTPGDVTIESSDGKRAQAGSAEQLLKQEWGFNLPVSNLRYWVRGIPVPGASHQDTFDAYHRLASFTQQGYRIEYLAYSRTDKIDLPAKISITSPQLKTKIFIYKWSV